MLVLSRKVGQQICIGDEITVTFIRVNSDGSVRLGINAPKDVTIYRKEIQERIDDDRSREHRKP